MRTIRARDGVLRRPGMVAAAAAAGLTLAVGACLPSHGKSPTTPPASTQTAQGKDELHQALSALAKGENDKVQLAWYATSFLRHLDPSVESFAKQMGKQQKDLLDGLKKLAKARGISLKFEFPDTIKGRGRKLMEKAQGDEVQNASNEDFQRDVVTMMYMDYKDQLYLAESMQKSVKDPELQVYLEKFQTVYKDGIKQLGGLMKRYKFQ